MRSALVALAEVVSVGLVAPLLIAYRAGGLSYHSGGQILSLVPGQLGIHLRRAWYSRTLTSCGGDLIVQMGAVLHKADARIGSRCYFGENNRVGLVTIGDDFMSSNSVSLMSGRRQHSFDRRDIPVKDQSVVFERITIGDDVWIGAHAVIAANVVSHSIVATGAVVINAASEPWQILGGVPARVLGERP